MRNIKLKVLPFSVIYIASKIADLIQNNTTMKFASTFQFTSTGNPDVDSYHA